MAEDKKEKVETLVRYSPLAIGRLVRMHWNGVPKEPMHLSGEPSTVKSAAVYAEAILLAEQEKRELFDWNRSTMDEKKTSLAEVKKYFVFADIRASETDIGEMRLQDMKNGEEYITYKYNLLFQVLSRPGAVGILFFDEMNLAPNMIKQQFYKLINDRCIGDIPIADGVLTISAGNEAEHARGVTEDPVPLVLRRANYFVRPPTQEEFQEYAVKTGHHQWIIGYLAFAPTDVHRVKYDLPDGVGQPCVRTWTKLSNLLNNNERLSDDEVRMLATGWVGQAAAKQFIAYVKTARKVNIGDFLKNPALIKEFEGDLSMCYAIFTGMVEKFREDKKVVQPAFEMSLHIKRKELGTYMLRSMKSLSPTGFMKAAGSDKLLKKETMDAVVDQYGDFLIGDPTR